MKSMTGRCLCGAVKFVAEEVKTDFDACHCSMCRRWTSGPFFSTQPKNVVFEGTDSLGRYPSSDWAERGFCKTCGSTLFYYLKPAQTFAMSVGAFDDSAVFRLIEEIYVDSKPDGYALAGDHPRLTEAETLAKFGFSQS